MAEAPAPADASSEAQGKTAVKDGGLLLGRFELGRLLGAGTFAKVYFARNPRTGEHVAIKALDKAKVLRGGLVPHIKREIAVLRRVRHPYIVQLHEVMATRTKIYFVMEYVSGGELFSRVAKGRMREDAARRYFQQLISAVAFCHARGVFHRDLKPENLLVDDAGDLKVSDFGLSAVSDQMPGDGLFHTLCGTPAYVAPEVLSRRGYDGAKVDIWSCGVILFVLMAGYLPFQDQNLMAMYRKINKGEFRCPGWFSPDLIRLLRHLLDVNPQTRFSIPDIMDHPWFKKGFRLVRVYIEDHQLHNLDSAGSSQKHAETHDLPADDAYDSGSDSDGSVVSCPEKSFNGRRVGQAIALPRPMSLNVVSSSETSSIEQPRRLGRLPRPLSLTAFDIISFSQGFDLSGLFEETGEKTRFLSTAPVSVIIAKLEEIAKLMSFSARRSGYTVSLEGTIEGEKGPLKIAAEIFELTRSIVVVEVTKKSGDREEYEEFCTEELKPALRHLVYESPPVGKMSSTTNCNLEERKEKQEV